MAARYKLMALLVSLCACQATFGDAEGETGSPAGGKPAKPTGAGGAGSDPTNPNVMPDLKTPGASTGEAVVKTGPDCPREPLGIPSSSPRLSERQFKNTMVALFPFPIDVGSKYPWIRYKKDFTSFPATQEVQFADIQNLVELSESVAMQAVAKIAMILPCSPTNNESACARQFIETFGARAFRRPLEKDESDKLAALYDAVRKAPDALDFNLAIAAVISSTLQSSPFLYRLEIGEATKTAGLRRLTGYETAARLSYLYWEAPPDAMLIDKAKAGALADAKTVETEARRLLMDPRARDAVWRFFSEWLGTGDEVFSSRVDPMLAADMADELKRFTLSVALDNPAGSWNDLLTSSRTFLTKRLAQHYGTTYTGAMNGDFAEGTPPMGLKAGILAKAQMAMSQSSSGDTSVVHRGVFLLERMVCADMGAPPPGVESMNPVLPPSATVRQRIDARMAMPICSGCHRRIDPAGIGLEDMDHLGRFRKEYGPGRPVDTKGVLAELGTGKEGFDGTADVAARLAGEKSAAACMAREWYRYSMGREETDKELRCHVRRLYERFNQNNLTIRDLLVAVGASDALVYRTDAPAKP